jgi:hypothetical protein
MPHKNVEKIIREWSPVEWKQEMTEWLQNCADKTLVLPRYLPML